MNSRTQDCTEQSTQPQKFLRYRSVRKTAATAPVTDEPPPPLPTSPVQTTSTSITRLPSRYHRKVKPITGSEDVPTSPPQHSLSRQQAYQVPDKNVSAESTPAKHLPTSAGASDATRRARGEQSQRSSGRDTRSKGSEGSAYVERHRRSYEAAREEARLILEGETERLKVLREQEAKRRREQRAIREKQQEQERLAASAKNAVVTESNRTQAAESKTGVPHVEATKEHSGQAQHKNENPTVKEIAEPVASKSRRHLLGNAFAVRSEKKHWRTSSAVDYQSRNVLGVDGFRTNNNQDGKRNSAPGAKFIAYDAPISAVNSGDRNVCVKYKEQTYKIPITPTTICKDVLNSISKLMLIPLDVPKAVLLESFSQLGLERPIRRYERIREVMNSWDNDTQHHLFIMEESECAAPGLHAADAPSHEPYGMTVQIYQSSKPGKWDKRWVKLWENGQISVSKHESGIDGTNICHLSDFDAYTPTAKQIKKLKPPKKFCFALKSQQKSSMFLSGENFAHFFCTKDKELADRWYHAVHSWRSWYLVCKLGGSPLEIQGQSENSSGSRPGTTTSNETMPYVLGSFKPLNFDFAPSRPSVDRRADVDSSKHSSREGLPRPLIDQVPSKPSIDVQRRVSVKAGKLESMPSKEFQQRQPGPEASHVRGGLEDADSGPFTGTGLLARSSTQKSQGGRRSGRGVSGVAGKPLVDLGATSEFADGSLLRKMEAIAAQQGSVGPKIDRQKRREMNAPVGEGF